MANIASTVLEASATEAVENATDSRKWRFLNTIEPSLVLS